MTKPHTDGGKEQGTDQGLRTGQGKGPKAEKSGKLEAGHDKRLEAEKPLRVV